MTDTIIFIVILCIAIGFLLFRKVKSKGCSGCSCGCSQSGNTQKKQSQNTCGCASTDNSCSCHSKE